MCGRVSRAGLGELGMSRHGTLSSRTVGLRVGTGSDSDGGILARDVLASPRIPRIRRDYLGSTVLISVQEGRSGQLTTWSIRAVVLVAFLDLFMQLPVISAYAKSLGATASMGGAIVGMYSASNLAATSARGAAGQAEPQAADSGRDAAHGASLYLYNFTETPGQLLALRAFHGLAAGVLAPGAFTMLGDHTTRHHTRSIGMTGALIAVSAVIGPPVAGVIRDLWGFGAVFTTSGTLMLLAAVVFWVRAPAIPMESVEGQDAGGRRLAAGMWRRLIPVFCAVLAMTFGIGSLINHLPIALEVAGPLRARRALPSRRSRWSRRWSWAVRRIGRWTTFRARSRYRGGCCCCAAVA